MGEGGKEDRGEEEVKRTGGGGGKEDRWEEEVKRTDGRRR